jgi:azurin
VIVIKITKSTSGGSGGDLVRTPFLILFTILSVLMLLAVACGSDEADPEATDTPAPPNTVPAASRTPEPTVTPRPTLGPTKTLPPVVATTGPSGTEMLDIDVLGNTLAFNTDRMSVSAGSEVVVNFNNSSAINLHNWVLVEAGTKDAVAADGIAAGQDNNWIPVNDPRVLASTVLIDPQGSAQAAFTAPPTGIYQFVCTFPGHSPTMFGDFTVN